MNSDEKTAATVEAIGAETATTSCAADAAT
jgi:hypothetical protein